MNGILKQYFVDTSKIISSNYERSKSIKHKGAKGNGGAAAMHIRVGLSNERYY